MAVFATKANAVMAQQSNIMNEIVNNKKPMNNAVKQNLKPDYKPIFGHTSFNNINATTNNIRHSTGLNYNAFSNNKDPFKTHRTNKCPNCNRMFTSAASFKNHVCYSYPCDNFPIFACIQINI